MDSKPYHDALVQRLRSFGLQEDMKISDQAAQHCEYMAKVNKEIEAPPVLLGNANQQAVLMTFIPNQSLDQTADQILIELARKNPQLFNPGETIGRGVTRAGGAIRFGEETHKGRQAYISIRLAEDRSRFYPEVWLG